MLQFKIALTATDPLIWRRVVVPHAFTFDQLHKVIQALFAWQAAHLYEFGVGTTYPRKKISGRTPLAEFFTSPRQACTYTYDFGDNWEHDVVYEREVSRPETADVPCCTAGAQNAPPEDCGGVPGYYALLEAVNDPDHPEHDDLCTWLGGPFDPAQCDLAAINAQLKKIKIKKSKPAQ